MPLQRGPASEPDRGGLFRRRVRTVSRPDGVLQCNRCGGRTVLNTENGVVVKRGRRLRGTRVDTDVCANCWTEGITVPMQATTGKTR